MKLDGSISAVVTGGASGLGRATAKALADTGVKVAIFDINEEAGEAFATEIGGVFCNVDIMSEESVLAGFEKARAAHGQERVLVHCAVVAAAGKTVSWDKEKGAYKRMATELVARAAEQHQQMGWDLHRLGGRSARHVCHSSDASDHAGCNSCDICHGTVLGGHVAFAGMLQSPSAQPAPAHSRFASAVLPGQHKPPIA